MWVPLHQHSQYSILDGACPIEAIARRASEHKMCACALTDHGNLHGAIDFYKACLGFGVKPIIGCECYVAPGSRFEKKKTGNKSAYHLGLLAKNQTGYRNLIALSSLGYLEGFYYHPRIDKELLTKHKEGLICLSGCLSSEVATLALQGDEDAFFQGVKWYHDLFGEDYYLELQRHRMSEEELNHIDDQSFLVLHREIIEKQEKQNRMILEASERFGIKCIATNDTHYLDKKDYFAHEILINIQSGEPIEIWERDPLGEPKFRVLNPKRRMYATRECYFKSPSEMSSLFADIPDSITHTLEIAEKCSLKLDFEKKHYPLFIPDSLKETNFDSSILSKEVEKTLRILCEAGISKRYSQVRLEKVQRVYPGRDAMEVVRSRLEYELNLIVSKGMADYLLIVWDIIHWAKSQGIPVGPGRGSGAGSIILYLIGVTDIEPLGFHLFFERFINPERISYPDIDVDICMDRRAEVVEYVVSKYGKDSVAQIATFGSIKAKMAIRDVGRVLSIPLAKVNGIAKLVPEDPGMTLNQALTTDPDLLSLTQTDPDAKKVVELGMALEGGIRSVGTHAAGIIISPGRLIDYIPVCLAKDADTLMTQYSMKPVEAIGMLKMDLLGLKTLTCIQMAVNAVRENEGIEVDWSDLSLEDRPTFQLLQQGKTLGVFQMESGGMQELSRNLKPDCFEDIIAIGALYRPGPMEMIPSFISRKHKKEPIEYDHPAIEAILRETYGIMVYQEQVMQIAQELAGYSLGEGDVLRRAMGKKDKIQMEKERDKFCKGASLRAIDPKLAESIFDKMEKFASYGFNKSHAAAYAYLTYATAYFKANYPMIWMAALMTCDRDDTSKLSKWIRECQAMGIRVLAPHINESSNIFIATPSGIRFAMTGIKGIGEGVVDVILSERAARGPYLSYLDFFQRIDLKRVGKKSIEHLVFAGAFDWTTWPREALCANIEEMYETVLQTQKEKEKGIMTFFSLLGDDETKDHFSLPTVGFKKLLSSELYQREKALLGFYITGHPLEAYLPSSKRLGIRSLSDLITLKDRDACRIMGIIESVDIKHVIKTQRKFAIVTISDGLETLELFVFSDLFESKMALLEENRLLYAVVTLDKRDESPKLIASWLEDLARVDEKVIQACDVAYDKAKHAAHRSFRDKVKPQATPKVEESASQIILRADLDKFRLSSIIALKKAFKTHPGSSPVKIEFHTKERKYSTLFIDKSFGIAPSAEWQAILKEIEGIEIES